MLRGNTFTNEFMFVVMNVARKIQNVRDKRIAACSRMKPTGPARSGRPDDRLRAIRGTTLRVAPDPGFRFRSIQATLRRRSPVLDLERRFCPSVSAKSPQKSCFFVPFTPRPKPPKMAGVGDSSG